MIRPPKDYVPRAERVPDEHESAPAWLAWGLIVIGAIGSGVLVWWATG